MVFEEELNLLKVVVEFEVGLGTQQQEYLFLFSLITIVFLKTERAAFLSLRR